MALIEFTRRAERSLLEIVGGAAQLDETLLFVEMHEHEAQVSFKKPDELPMLQSDIDVVGPFRVEICGEEVSLFVREPEPPLDGKLELDYDTSDGHNRFQVRELAG